MPPSASGSASASISLSDPLPEPTDINATWAFIEVGIDLMMTKLKEGMIAGEYMKLYSAVYNHCTSSRINTDSNFGQASARSGANLMGAQLYYNLTTYLRNHLKNTAQQIIGSDTLAREDLLDAYSAEWDRYTLGAMMLNRLFAYLNRHWVKREKDEGRKNVYTIYTLALVTWKECIFGIRERDDRSSDSARGLELQDKVRSALLQVIEKQRDGEEVRTGVIKSVISSLVNLGLDPNEAQRENLEFYKSVFFDPLLTATEAYYRTESQQFIKDNSVTEYMKKAEVRLKEEEDRVDMYLHQSSRKDLVLRCENCLVLEHSEIMQDEFLRLLTDEKDEDLQRMYALLARIPDGLDPLRSRFEDHVKKSGLANVVKIASGENIEPKAYVESLLEVHTQNADLVDKAFGGETGFVASLDKACREFVNRNAVTGTSSSKSPELLAKHTNILLSKSNKGTGENDDVENAQKNVMTIFKYIEDKDVFQRFYSKLLAKRLVAAASASDFAEESMINRLKDACGFEYTSKLSRMFTDMQTCGDLNAAYSRLHKESSKFDFHVLVLGTGHWPLYETVRMTLPTELMQSQDKFKMYYDTKHSGRKLTWLYAQCRADLRTTFTKPQYTMSTSAYQAAVLLLFNTMGDSISYDEIKDNLNLTHAPQTSSEGGATKEARPADDVLKQVLDLLVKFKVISEKDGNYELNLGYKSKKIKVNLNAPIRSEQKAETSDVMKNVDEDRKLLVQAIIVRIMKSRKTMKYQALIQETVAQLSSRFTPRIPDIKKAIEYLVEKDYMEREEDSRDTFKYLA